MIKKLVCVIVLIMMSCIFSSCIHIHDWSEWTIVREAVSCDEDGLKIRECTSCPEVEKSAIKIPHTIIVDEGVLPTCVKDGVTAGEHCSACGEVLVSQEVIPMLFSHNYIDGVCTMCKTAIALEEKVFDDALPVFYIETNGVTIPDRSHPEYKNYAECNIELNDGEDRVFQENAKIRIRGTSSRWFAKKGYKLKFTSAKSLEELPEAKKYNLLASYPDPCKLRDYLALSISYTMNFGSDRYAPRPILSRVYLDGVYQGLYFLLDDIDSGKGKIELEDFTAADKEIPFILEMDTVAYKTGVEGVDYFSLGRTDVFDYDGDGSTELLYVIDSPENITQEQFSYIERYIGECRGSLEKGDLKTFSDLVDVASFIDYFMLGELFRNTDMAGRSVYMYKEGKEGKLVFGPSWDFDYSCSRPYRLGPNIDYSLHNAKDRFTNYDWWQLFLEIPEAVQLIKERYTLYLRDIYVHEFAEAKKFYAFYESDIKTDAVIWYAEDVENTDALVDDNFVWTFNYFDLRLEMLDGLFLLQDE